MGTLTFKIAEIEAIISEVERATELRSYYGNKIGPSVFLVGDQGVYLMGNHAWTDKKDRTVAYAVEVDPDTLPFDEWWENKNAIFGGDDGVEVLNLTQVGEWVGFAKRQGREFVTIDMTPREIALNFGG